MNLLTNTIFICYRRDDSADVTGRLWDRLELAFPAGTVFRDVDNIPLGVDFRTHVGRALSSCSVVLVIIGPSWLHASEGWWWRRRRRLDNPRDFVRIEIEQALARKQIRVIPVLVGGAKMPQGDALPKTLEELAFRHAAELRRDPDFRTDVERLIRKVSQYFSGDSDGGAQLSETGEDPILAQPKEIPANEDKKTPALDAKELQSIMDWRNLIRACVHRQTKRILLLPDAATVWTKLGLTNTWQRVKNVFACVQSASSRFSQKCKLSTTHLTSSFGTLCLRLPRYKPWLKWLRRVAILSLFLPLASIGYSWLKPFFGHIIMPAPENSKKIEMEVLPPPAETLSSTKDRDALPSLQDKSNISNSGSAEKLPQPHVAQPIAAPSVEAPSGTQASSTKMADVDPVKTLPEPSADRLPPINAKKSSETNAVGNEVSIPFGITIPSSPGYVRSPYVEGKVINVRGLSPGSKATCPYSNKVFRVPFGF